MSRGKRIFLHDDFLSAEYSANVKSSASKNAKRISLNNINVETVTKSNLFAVQALNHPVPIIELLARRQRR